MTQELQRPLEVAGKISVAKTRSGRGFWNEEGPWGVGAPLWLSMPPYKSWECPRRLHAMGVQGVVPTCDGPWQNIATIQELGAIFGITNIRLYVLKLHVLTLRPLTTSFLLHTPFL